MLIINLFCIIFREDSSDTDLDGDFSDLETPEGILFFCTLLMYFILLI